MFVLPAIFFSFDGSLGVTDLTEDVRNRKHITFALIGWMLIVTITYILVTIAILNTGTLNAEDAIIKMFGSNPTLTHTETLYIVIGTIMQLFIIISALGVVNGTCISWTRGTKSVIKNSTHKKVFIVMMLTVFFNFIIPLVTISLIVNYTGHGGLKGINVQLVNMLTINTTLIIYLIYATIISICLFKYSKNLFAKEKIYKYSFKSIFPYFAIISIIGISIVVGYQFIYIFIYQTIYLYFYLSNYN